MSRESIPYTEVRAVFGFSPTAAAVSFLAKASNCRTICAPRRPASQIDCSNSYALCSVRVTSRASSADPMITQSSVVEVVRDAARQSADRLHLLRLRQLGLEVLALRIGVLPRGDVHVRAQHSQRSAALVLEQRCLRENPPVRAVLVAEAELDVEVVPAPLCEGAHDFDDPLAILGMDAIPPLRDAAGDLVVFVAYLTLPLGRVEGGIGIEIPVPQADVCGRDSRPQLQSGALYRRLGPDSLSDLALELQDLLLELVDQNFVVQPVVDGLVVRGRRRRGEMSTGMLFEHFGDFGDEDIVADRLDDEPCRPELLGKRLVLRAGVRRRVEDERNVSEDPDRVCTHGTR